MRTNQAPLRYRGTMAALASAGCVLMLSPLVALAEEGSQDEQRSQSARPEVGRNGLLHGPRVELSLGALSPDEERYDDAFFTTLSVDAVGVSHAPFGLAVGYSLGVGLNSDASGAFDAQIAVGPGLRLGPFMLASLVGGGADVLGEAGRSDYGFAPAPYLTLGGRARLEQGLVGFEAGGQYLLRNAAEGDTPPVPHEVRFGARVFLLIEAYYELSLGFSYTDYTSADAFAGSLGFGF